MVAYPTRYLHACTLSDHSELAVKAFDNTAITDVSEDILSTAFRLTDAISAIII